MREISPRQLEQALSEGLPYVIIDVRENYEVRGGMIPKSKHIPMNEIPNHLSRFKKGVTYVIYCKSGKRSASVCRLLESHGFTVLNLTGGISAWTGPIEKK